MTGIGEATLEWQEKTVQTLLHEWVEARVLGKDPFDIEATIGGMVRDQYQGGADDHDGDQRRRDRDVGLDRQGMPPAGLPPARRPLPRSHPHLRQRMVWRSSHARSSLRSEPQPPSTADIVRSSSTRSELPGSISIKMKPIWRSKPWRQSGRPSGLASALMIEFHGRLAAGTATATHPSARTVRSGVVRRASRP